MEPARTNRSYLRLPKASSHDFRGETVSFSRKSPEDLLMSVDKLLTEFDSHGTNGCIEIHFNNGLMVKVFKREVLE